jgi:uncharacterized membrane protein
MVLITGFSLLGLMLFLVTISKLLVCIKPFFKSEKLFLLVKILLFLSNGYGIYLGRFLRFNSWDIVSAPDELIVQMYNSLADKANYKETIGITLTFTIFLYLIFGIYESFDNRVEEKQNELF